MDFYYGYAKGDSVILSDEEFNHLKNVKRIKNGDEVMVTDGNGNLYHTEFAGNQAPLRIVRSKTFLPANFSLHIAVAPTKSIDRIEWFLEKAVETGISEVSFILCRHSERKEIKSERMQRIAVSALKQSKKVFLPKINEMIPFNAFIKNKKEECRLLFTQQAGANATLSANYNKKQNLLALIGPEGDFHDDEIALAKADGFQLTSLGNSRLRTETAALAVCTLFNFINSQ
jgi:16S rRNA (uracil1498-N3)-methyltransferase